MAHFDCKNDEEYCILTERDPQHSQIPHIQSVVNWITTHGGSDLMPKYIWGIPP